jgi:hypothetical protein
MDKRLEILTPLYIFGYLLQPNAENMTQSFLTFFKLWQLKKKFNSFSHYSFLISRFGKISPIIKLKKEPVASQSSKP